MTSPSEVTGLSYAEALAIVTPAKPRLLVAATEPAQSMELGSREFNAIVEEPLSAGWAFDSPNEGDPLILRPPDEARFEEAVFFFGEAKEVADLYCGIATLRRRLPFAAEQYAPLSYGPMLYEESLLAATHALQTALDRYRSELAELDAHGFRFPASPEAIRPGRERPAPCDANSPPAAIASLQFAEDHHGAMFKAGYRASALAAYGRSAACRALAHIALDRLQTDPNMAYSASIEAAQMERDTRLGADAPGCADMLAAAQDHLLSRRRRKLLSVRRELFGRVLVDAEIRFLSGYEFLWLAKDKNLHAAKDGAATRSALISPDTDDTMWRFTVDPRSDRGFGLSRREEAEGERSFNEMISFLEASERPDAEPDGPSTVGP